MSPDAGRTENQKHKQYKLVLKSSELDRLLLPRLCFRSSWPRASPGMGGERGPTPGRTAVWVVLPMCSCALVSGRACSVLAGLVEVALVGGGRQPPPVWCGSLPVGLVLPSDPEAMGSVLRNSTLSQLGYL